MTKDLTALERAALDAICRQQDGPARTALRRQLATARVANRENSGVGFFTALRIDPNTPPVPGGASVLGDVTATIDGFENPLLLLLFMTDGYADMLEGATVGDSTEGLDLAALRFRITGA